MKSFWTTFYRSPCLILAAFVLLSCGAGKAGKGQITAWIPGDEVEYGFYFDAMESFQKKLEAEGREFDYIVEQQPWGDYWTKLPLEINNGRGPDLFLTHWAYDKNLRGITKELELTEAELGQFEVSDLYPGPNGKPVYIPTTFVSKVMFVNRALAPNFNVAAADSWEGLRDELAKLGGALPEGVVPFQWSFHMLYDLRYDAGFTFTDSNGEFQIDDSGFDYLASLEQRGISQYIERSGPSDELNNSTVAVIYGEPWMEFWAAEDVKGSLEAFPVPGSATVKALELSFGINKNVDDGRFALLNEFVKYILMDKQVNASIVEGSSGTPNLRGQELEYRPGSAGAANLASDHARLLIPSVRFEDVIRQMLGDWEGLGGAKTTEQTLQDARIAAESVDLTGLAALEDRFR